MPSANKLVLIFELDLGRLALAIFNTSNVELVRAGKVLITLSRLASIIPQIAVILFIKTVIVDQPLAAPDKLNETLKLTRTVPSLLP